jgi:regulation of enolase protein 1 (concanavalin A-like superfamily)
MIRETLNANSTHAMTILTPAQGVSFQRRKTTGGASSETTTTGLAAPYWIRLVRAGDLFTSYRSSDGVTWTSIGSETIAMNTEVYMGLAVTSHADGTLCTATFDNVSFAAVPSPWQSADIGAVAVAGSTTRRNGVFTVDGSGADIWGVADEFRYVYQTATGDCVFVARVSSVENTNNWAKAGVMIRETLDANARHATVVLTPAQGVSFARRKATGEGSSETTTGGLTAPYWVRVVRSGDVFTASRSSDGTSWTTIGSETIAMSANVYIGLAVSSHNDGTLCTATFDNASVTP